MESDFEFEMPKCYNEVVDNSEFDANDFSLRLEFKMDKECFDLLKKNLNSKNKYFQSIEDDISRFYKEINSSEYAKLELNNIENSLKYLFIYH